VCPVLLHSPVCSYADNWFQIPRFSLKKCLTYIYTSTRSLSVCDFAQYRPPPPSRLCLVLNVISLSFSLALSPFTLLTSLTLRLSRGAYQRGVCLSLSGPLSLTGISLSLAQRQHPYLLTSRSPICLASRIVIQCVCHGSGHGCTVGINSQIKSGELHSYNKHQQHLQYCIELKNHRTCKLRSTLPLSILALPRL